MTLLEKRFHPLGGFYIESALKWLIPLNVIMLFVGLAMLAHDVYALWDRWWNIERLQNQQDFYIRLTLWLGYILHVIIAMPMDLVLYRAKLSKHIKLLKFWSVGNFINSIWGTLDYWIHTFYFGIHFPSLVPYNFYCIYKFYMCIVVHYFCLDIIDEREIEAAARCLSDKEIQEFEEGLLFEDELELSTRQLMDRVQYQKYKRKQYEIDPERLQVDFENPLGSGAYGIVYRGTYAFDEDKAPEDVAIKTFESSFLDALCFKALLSELKVMTYLGQHENIVNLIGADTSKIRTRELRIVVEFCPFGNLLEFLRASRGLFINLVKEGKFIENSMEIHSKIEEDQISTISLIQWSRQIANGMNYLEEKKVVHGDLAARNLLLTDSKEIKIGDFGLARQLYQYSVYVKRQNVPLPWRWLALESLTDMDFSTKSDVWSFGIVLIEVFTIGEVPYGAATPFSLDFIESLKDGMRPEAPSFCPSEVNRIMDVCWAADPLARPSFLNLYEMFTNILTNAYSVVDLRSIKHCPLSLTPAPMPSRLTNKYS